MAQNDDFALRAYNRNRTGEPPQETPVNNLSNLRELAARNKVPLLAPRRERPELDEARQASRRIQNAVNNRRAVGRGQMLGVPGTSPRGVGGTSPLTASLLKAKGVVRAAMLGNYDLGDLRDQVEDLQNDPNIDVNTFKGILQEVVKQAQNTPTHTIPGGSVDISRGNGPNRMSQEAFKAGEERQQANLKPGEELQPEGDSAYKVKLPDTVQEPLPGGKAAKPVAEPKESEYQKAQYTSAEQAYRQAQEDAKQAKLKLETGTDAEGNKIDPNDTNTEQWKDYQHALQVVGQKQNEFLNLQKALPGGPNATTAATPAPVAPPAPAPPVAQPGVATPQSPAAVHPVTGLPIAATVDHYASIAPGAIYHGPDGKMYRKAPAPPPSSPLPTAQSPNSLYGL